MYNIYIREIIDLTKEQMDYILRFITLGICYLENDVLKHTTLEKA